MAMFNFGASLLANEASKAAVRTESKRTAPWHFAEERHTGTETRSQFGQKTISYRKLCRFWSRMKRLSRCRAFALVNNRHGTCSTHSRLHLNSAAEGKPMFELIVTYRPDFAEHVLERFPTLEEARA